MCGSRGGGPPPALLSGFCSLAGAAPALLPASTLHALPKAGANDSVILDLRGVSNVFVQPASPTTVISGRAQGINVVQAREEAEGRVGLAASCWRWARTWYPGCRRGTAGRCCSRNCLSRPAPLLQYTDGECRVAAGIPFLSVCQPAVFIALPAPRSVWSCGLDVQGNFTCSDGQAFRAWSIRAACSSCRRLAGMWG